MNQKQQNKQDDVNGNKGSNLNTRNNTNHVGPGQYITKNNANHQQVPPMPHLANSMAPYPNNLGSSNNKYSAPQNFHPGNPMTNGPPPNYVPNQPNRLQFRGLQQPVGMQGQIQSNFQNQPNDGAQAGNKSHPGGLAPPLIQPQMVGNQINTRNQNMQLKHQLNIPPGGPSLQHQASIPAMPRGFQPQPMQNMPSMPSQSGLKHQPSIMNTTQYAAPPLVGAQANQSAYPPGAGHYPRQQYSNPAGAGAPGMTPSTRSANRTQGAQPANAQAGALVPVQPPVGRGGQVLPTKGNARNQPKIAEFQAPKLQNLVSTANLNCELNLKDIAFKCRNAEYNPKRFAAVIMRMKEPMRTTALIFKTGKMVITGAKSEEDSKNAAKHYAKAIQKVGFKEVRLTDFAIQNMVGSCSVEFNIQLEKIQQSDDHRDYCDFNPETFPGLIYHMKYPAPICLLIFASGKIVLTGAKTRKAIDDAFEKMRPMLKKYVKKNMREEPAAASNERSTRRN